MDIDHSIRSYVAEAVGDCSVDRIPTVSRFETGERHAVYRVSYLDLAGETKDLVVRVSISGTASAYAQAEREATVLAKVQGHAGPLLYDFCPQSAWFDAPVMCMQLIPGPQTEVRTAAVGDLERLGSVVGWLHGLPTDDLADWLPERLSFLACLESHLEMAVLGRLPLLRDPLPARVQDRLKRAALLVKERVEEAREIESFSSDERLVLLHGDIADGNVIWGPEPVLIDWEYARLGDPADEVAYVFTQNDLSPTQREAFWRGYRDSTDPPGVEDVAARVGLWEPATLLGSVMWWIERWSARASADADGEVDPSAPKQQSYYLERALQRLDRFE
jgi:aminoglycoside phosphotransferase (APT) family kinase protein